MMAELSAWQVAAGSTIVGLGAFIQGSVGFGLGLIAAPVLALIDPRFVPAPLIANALILTLLVSYRERRSINTHAVGWAIAGCLAGTTVAASVLATLSPRGFSILFGVLVLLAVLLSALGFSIRPTGRNVLVAGTLAGFMGTTSSIGGPPVALIFQDMPGPELRGTLSAYFLGSTMLALTALTAIGRFGESELGLALSLLPGLLLGLALSSMTAGMLDRRGIRPLILLLSGLAGSAVLLRGLAALAA